MNESILRALMRLFAIVANVNKEGISPKSRGIVESYLNTHISNEQSEHFLNLFDEFLVSHHKGETADDGQRVRKRTSSNSVKVLMICHEINESLQQKEKFIVLFQLLEFVFEDSRMSDKEMDFIRTVSDTFNISEEEYKHVESFAFGKIRDISDKTAVLIVNNQTREDFYAGVEAKESWFKHIHSHYIDQEIVFYHIRSINTFVFRYDGNQTIFLNGHSIIPRRSNIMDTGSIIKSSIIDPIYFNDISSKFLQSGNQSRLVYNAENIVFRFKNSENGLHEFNFSEESGQLIGIMGGSGVGKSTLLNVLNGNIKPTSGSITINGLDLHKDKDKLEGAIGFVPQDDLLIEELSVYENLYYNAKLCFSNFTEVQIEEAVTHTLHDLDLYEIRDLKVGDPLNKFISGGQRKRLNIALELIREPSVMFVDEPTSGLSSMDSEMVMLLLKELALKGKLLIVNIHQPSSDIYKLFDKVMVMDKGGRPVYYGNPIDAVVYFKKMAHHVDAEQGQCMACGNINPEQVLQIVEAKVVNEYGKFTRVRKVSPQEWYAAYKEKIESKIQRKVSNEALPTNFFKVPSSFEQFRIFFIRNVLSKLTNKQYLIINLFEAPILALILAFFTKYISGNSDETATYLFSQNENLPSYMFMSVVVALFMGLTVSAEEIIKDRRLLKRESFLHLSYISYLNSKILFLFALSAFQMLTFVLIGNSILEIRGMNFYYFLILFSTTAFANMVGLNISAGLNSVVTIYILIPLILVPQLLLSGTIVNFNKLHRSITNQKYVPVVGDFMTSRWAYEAMAVAQFKHNKYERYFYDVEQRSSYASYRSVFLLSQLESKITQIEKAFTDETKKATMEKDLQILKTEVMKLRNEISAPEFKMMANMDPGKFDQETANALREYLDKYKAYFNKIQTKANYERDSLFNALIEKWGDKEQVYNYKTDYYNEYLADMVLNTKEVQKIYETEDELIQRKDPVFMKPQSNYGRAHFYAPIKIVGSMEIDTFWFNTIFIWLTTLVMYLALITDLLRKLIERSSGLGLLAKLRKQ